MSYVGPLTKIGTSQARVVPDVLERELAVRKMERNVNELERLRRLDEDAGARQRERRRQLELESQRLEAERAAAARRNGAGGYYGANGAVDGWQATPVPAEAGQSAGQDDSNVHSVQPKQQSRPSSRRYRPPTNFRRKPKPKSFSNQVFGID